MKTSNQKRYLRRRKLFRTIFGVFSLSGILFAFQACYGTPQDFGQDIVIKGRVISAAKKTPVSGIRIQLNITGQYTLSDLDGTYSIYSERMPDYNLTFIDTDGAENGRYQVCDTTVQLGLTETILTLNVELK